MNFNNDFTQLRWWKKHLTERESSLPVGTNKNVLCGCRLFRPDGMSNVDWYYSLTNKISWI